MPRVSSRGRRKSRKHPPPTWCGVLDHPQGSVSSTCLRLQAFPSLQFFASISGFNFLHRFWLSWKSSFPLLYPPHGLRFPTGQSDSTIFPDFFVFFDLLFFCCFFGLLFYPFSMIWRSPGDPKIKPKLVKICFRRGFLDDFHFCANF